MRPDQGDLLLIPIPFTDLSAHKRRPVIVISHDAYHRATADMIVVAMTSNPNPVPYSFQITATDLTRGTLNRPGTVRVDKIYTLSQSLIVQTFGQVNRATLDRIRAVVETLLTLPPETPS